MFESYRGQAGIRNEQLVGRAGGCGGGGGRDRRIRERCAPKD